MALQPGVLAVAAATGLDWFQKMKSKEKRIKVK
jgi:hypothetical protein